MALKRVKGWLFREGQYPDKMAPEADLGFLHRYAAGSNALPRIPLDFEHGPTERCFDFGQVVPGSVRVEHGLPPGAPPEDAGHWLCADVEIDEGVEQKLKARGLSVLLDLGREVVEKVAVTADPRVRSARFHDAGRQALELTGGYLMKVRFDGSTAGDEQQAEPELSDGFIARLRQKLGLTSEPAGDQSKQAETTPAMSGNDESFATDPRVVALTGHLTAQAEEATRRAEAAEKAAAAAMTSTRGQVIEARAAEFKAAGVPPWLVDALAPIAYGEPKAVVAFTDADGKPQTKEVDASGVALHVLEQFRGAAPMERRLPANDDRQRSTSPDDRVVAETNRRVAAMRAEGKPVNVALVQDVVLAEYSAQEGQ